MPTINDAVSGTGTEGTPNSYTRRKNGQEKVKEEENVYDHLKETITIFDRFL